MRGEELQELIIAGIDGLSVDLKAVVTDKFRHDAGQVDDGNVRPDRSWQLVQGQLSLGSGFNQRTMRSVFEGWFYYSESDKTAPRIISDGERVLCFLPTIGAAMHPDIVGCTDIGDWIPSEDDVTGQIVCKVSWAVTYMVTGV